MAFLDFARPRYEVLAREVAKSTALARQNTNFLLGLGDQRSSDQTIELTKEPGPTIWSNPIVAHDAHDLFRSIFVTGQQPRHGTRELMAAYSTMPLLRRAVNRIARDIANVKIKLYYAKGKAGPRLTAEYKSAGGRDARHQMNKDLQRTGDLRELSPDHPAYQFLNAGNPKLPGRKARFVTQIFNLLKGDTYSIKVRNNFGTPVRWYPIPPYWMIMAPTSTRPLFRFQYGTWYWDCPEQDVMWCTSPDPVNPYGRGVGIGESLADDLEGEKFASRFIKQSLRNGAQTGGIIKVAGATKQQLREFEQRWNEKHLGIERAGKVYFTGADIDFKSFEHSFKELELTKYREFETKLMRETWGIPPEMDGEMRSSDRIAIAGARYVYLENTITPPVEEETAEWQYQLGTEFNGEVIADYDPFVPADQDRILNIQKTFRECFRKNEIRESAGYNPVSPAEGGEDFLLPASGAAETTTEPKPENKPQAEPLDPDA